MDTKRPKRWTGGVSLTLFVMMAVIVSVVGTALPAAAAVTFSAAVSFGTGTAPSSTAVGDFNGDGIPDLATANFGDPLVSDGSIAVRLGSGAGAFLAPVLYPAGTGVNPDAIIAVDVNGDGILDLVTANSSSDDISVLLGNGNGTFQPAVWYTASFSGGGPIALVAGDFNNDGKLDIATANNSDSTVSVLLGNGAGGFTLTWAQIHSMVNDSPGPIALVAGDFDTDGKLDIVTANSGDSTVSVLLGDGAGGFVETVVSTLDDKECTAGQKNTTGQTPIGIVVADFNADQKPDLATANSNDSMSVMLGKGNGSFEKAVIYAAGTTPGAIATADFEGDGKMDLVVANSFSDDISYFRGNGDGSFLPAVSYPVSATTCTATPCSNPYAVIAVDVNGNGGPDLVVSNNWSNNVSILADVQVNANGISGMVTDGAGGVKNAILTLSSGATTTGVTATTDPNGAYSFTGLANGTYNVTPSKNGMSFTPANTSVTILNNTKTNINFAINPVTITATAGAYGAISPQGAVAARYQSDQTFQITPTAGYHVADVKVDGVSVGAVTAYTLPKVTAGHAINATFALNTYVVTPAGTTGGTMGGNHNVDHGSSTSFIVTPDEHYHLVSVAGCGGTLSGNTFTTGQVTGNCTVTATFTLPDGDLGHGGSINDALKALLIASKITAPTSDDLLRGDVAPLINGKPSPDGKIDISDVIVILRKSLGLVSWQ